EALDVATEEEVALFRQYTDELCELDNIPALYAKAYACYGGNRAYPCDWVMARNLLLRLSSLSEDPFVANTLGYLFYYGRCTGGKPEYDKAFQFFSIGAAGGVYESRYKLSDMYLHGYGVEKNERVAAHLVWELYEDLQKTILSQNLDSKFADVAFRVGNLLKNGIDCAVAPDLAYYYYLQADFAIRMRMIKADYYGDAWVAKRIAEAMEEVLPDTSYTEPCYTTHFFSLQPVISGILQTRRGVEAKLKRLKDGAYSLRLRPLPRYNEPHARMFLTIPEAHFCGFLDSITLRVDHVDWLAINGEEFSDTSATVCFDGFDPFFGICTLCGKEVLEIVGNFSFSLRSIKDAEKYQFVSVALDEYPFPFEYRCDDAGIKPGARVLTDTGEEVGTVLKVYKKTKFETEWPLNAYDFVTRVEGSAPPAESV
ncbi:MAG TPA: hypothetical protein PLS28_00720, partial [Clostridiales bacterium]|nr:hypothetical protein [Clostridiales bacterium]